MSSNNEPKKIESPVTGPGIEHALEQSKKDAGPSEAKQHVDNVKKGGKGSEGPDQDTLKIIGGVVAAVALIAIGVTIKKKSSGGKKEKAEEETHGFLNKAEHKAKSSGRWLGGKAESANEKAGDKADDFGSRISGAASATKDKASEIIPQPVKDSASNISDRVNVAGIKAEKEGLKASEKSDHAVRDAADKLIHNTDKAGNKADQKSGGFFSGLFGKKDK